ncbi:TetR/AcrR family transcriptional regulator [Streptomyces sp. XD-27]|uniref:TetR/AcrR family transcriptional regulator n=1 Tax=Streptomyces sp. XD-27 TaxID=3062779 RepID=UPI0026F40E85|nr:TetR/AcrR family transcriptional regulator [Streptomyces sp. XD-27]WKX71149.1 TetR/AcrR family transcriptional regulator [Streptomyces sp. XD-27]
MGHDSGTGLPPSIEAAWGLRERPTKGPKRGLSLDRIVAGAVRVAAAEGLPAVSMGRVAKELGVSTMSLYRYVAAKDELLALMADAAYGTPPEPRPDLGWRHELTRWAHEMRAALLDHPWALRIPISGPPITPHQLAWFERALAALAGTRLGEGEKVSVVMLVSGHVKADATLYAEFGAALRAADSSPQDFMRSYGRTLSRLTDAERFPALTAALAAGAVDKPDGPDDEFVFGLDRILDGIEVLMRDRA